MTFSVILPYLLSAVAGWLVKHFGLIESLLGKASGPNPAAPASKPPPLPGLNVGNHPILSDAVNAAIKQAVQDAVSGHIASLKGEILASAKAAAEAAAADLKAKI